MFHVKIFLHQMCWYRVGVYWSNIVNCSYYRQEEGEGQEGKDPWRHW